MCRYVTLISVDNSTVTETSTEEDSYGQLFKVEIGSSLPVPQCENLDGFITNDLLKIPGNESKIFIPFYYFILNNS